MSLLQFNREEGMEALERGKKREDFSQNINSMILGNSCKDWTDIDLSRLSATQGKVRGTDCHK